MVIIIFNKTVRTTTCEIICNVQKCTSCKSYRAALRAIYHSSIKRATLKSRVIHNHTNERFLRTPEKKEKMCRLRKAVTSSKYKISKLENYIKKLNEKKVDEELNQDMVHILNSNSKKIQERYPEGTFARLFWEEQLKASSGKKGRQNRWHPLMIKWCLNLQLLSGVTYHTLRTSGFIVLPSERTLRDFTHALLQI